MVMPRYLACDTVSNSCPWSIYWILMIVVFLVTRMTWHFSRLNFIFHCFAHLSSVLRSSWSAAVFVLGLRAIYIMVSSAKNLTVEVILSGISLIYKWNRQGPSAEP